MENRYLNEEAFREFLDKVMKGTGPDSGFDLGIVDDFLKSFNAYVNEVVTNETKLLVNPRAEGKEYRDMVSKYDEARHNCHEAAIINTKALNRMAEEYGVSPVFTGDPTQRHQVADFCLEVDRYLFVNRRMKLA